MQNLNKGVYTKYSTDPLITQMSFIYTVNHILNWNQYCSPGFIPIPPIWELLFRKTFSLYFKNTNAHFQ